VDCLDKRLDTTRVGSRKTTLLDARHGSVAGRRGSKGRRYSARAPTSHTSELLGAICVAAAGASAGAEDEPPNMASDAAPTAWRLRAGSRSVLCIEGRLRNPAFFPDTAWCATAEPVPNAKP